MEQKPEGHQRRRTSIEALDAVDPPIVTPTRAVAHRVRELRTRHGWSAERLAQEMKKIGIPWERIVVTKLETGKRQSVSVEELLALAYVLDVAVVNLLVPLEDKIDGEPAAYRATPHMAPMAWQVRSWIRGDVPLPGQDPRIFGSEVPMREYRFPTGWAVDLDSRLAGAEEEAGTDG